jgi:hypothetical protein
MMRGGGKGRVSVYPRLRLRIFVMDGHSLREVQGWMV